MSSSGTASSIERVDARRLLVRLTGALEDASVQRLSEDLLPRLQEIGPGAELLIDMCGLDSCTADAREALIELQRGIAALSVRTAFVADRPRFRGVAMYVVHHADDMLARAFLVPAQADTWLRRTEGRIESITAELARTGTEHGKPARRSSDEVVAGAARHRDSSDDEEEPR